MNLTDSFPACLMILLALITIRVLGWLFRLPPPPETRYKSIDGLRGYLALFVFIHHSAIWYYFMKTGSWTAPPSNLYAHFGPTSVAFFFMITSFLFFSKLIEARGGSMDWLKFYTARVLRIMPLYLTILFALLIVIGFLTHFRLAEPFPNIVKETIQWLAFIEADLNTVSGTRLIVAGVVWSLAYEAMFYSSLPVMGLFLFRINASWKTLALSTLLLILFMMIIMDFYPFALAWRASPFLVGIAAAFLAKNAAFCKLASTTAASSLILLCSALLVILFPPFTNPLSYIPLSIIFMLIACGNSLFGALTAVSSRRLGQVSYSIYLLHGLLLFVLFRFVIGFTTASKLSGVAHWGIIAVACIILESLCSLTWRFIESPSIHAAPAVAARLRAWGRRLQKSRKLRKPLNPPNPVETSSLP